MTSSHKMRVVHMSSAHRPRDNRIVYKECTSLTAAGFDVTLVVPAPERDVVNGVEIDPVPLPRSRRERLLVTTWRVFLRALRLRADLYHVHDPELLPFVPLLWLLGRRVVLDVHENPDRTVGWVPPWFRRPLAAFSEVVHRCAAWFAQGVIAAAPRMGSFFPPDKTVIARNYPRIELDPPAADFDDRTHQVIYIGDITRQRGGVNMVEAIGRVDPDLDARLVIGGPFGRPRIDAEIEQLPGWRATEYLGVVDPADVPGLMRASRIGMGIYHPWPNYTHEVDNLTKLYEYMFAGVALILSDFPAFHAAFEDLGCALFVDPFDSDAIAEAIGYLLEHPTEAGEMGRRGREVVQERFNWHTEVGGIVDLYEQILNCSR